MSLFPTLNLDTLVDSINSQIEKESLHEIGEVILLEFNNLNQASVVIENGRPKFAETLEEKIQMYLQVLLRTELDKYEIYSGTGFGMTYFAFKGKKIPNSIVISEIKREITEKISKLSKFESITNFIAEMTESTLSVSFELNLNNNTTLKIEL